MYRWNLSGKRKNLHLGLVNTENSCFESAVSHLSETYRKIAYKILKEEYWNLVEGLDWIPSLHVRNMTSNLQRRLTDVLANIPNDQGIQKRMIKYVRVGL